MASGYRVTQTAPRDVNDVKPVIGSIYRARMYTRSGSIDVDTPLPETFPLNLETSWDTPFNQPISSMGGQSLQAGATAVTGVTGQTTSTKWLSGAVWTQGSAITMTIPFVFQAYSDPVKEVLEPMRDLMKMVAPSEGTGGLLKAPGPHGLSTSNSSLGGEYIIVEIGKFLKLEPVVITAVNEEFDTQFDAKGNPIAVTISVDIQSFWTVTQQDIDKFFVGVK